MNKSDIIIDFGKEAKLPSKQLAELDYRLSEDNKRVIDGLFTAIQTLDNFHFCVHTELPKMQKRLSAMAKACAEKTVKKSSIWDVI